MNISSLNNVALGTPSANTSQPNSAQGSVGSNSQLAPTTAPNLPTKPPLSNLSASSSEQDKRQTALQIVNQTLTAAYEKISARGVSASAEYSTFEPLTAEKVSNNILGFIERRLQLDVANGASSEELQARLEAGLSGFKKGFAEASEKLEALSLLSPEIKADVGKTYDLVLVGIDELRAKFIQSASAEMKNPTGSEPAGLLKTADSSKSLTKLDVPGFIPNSGIDRNYGSYEYGRARDFSFELKTKEGDRVTIKATASEGLAMDSVRAGQGGAGASSVDYTSKQSFALSVEGDLSEEELIAINDLLGRVNDLAQQFFEGDLDTAFQQAMDLGFDAEQIGSFSLNLAQVDIRQITQAYQAFEPNRSGSGSNNPMLLAEQLLPMGTFIKDLLASLDRASEFDEPKLLVSDLAEKITGETQVDQQQGQGFRKFVEEILALNLS